MKDVLYPRQEDYPILSWEILREAHSRYISDEPRDAMYRISTKLVEENWNEIEELSNSLGVLLLTWNSAFYRYGTLDYEKIQESLVKHKAKLDEFRNRAITTVDESEKDTIKGIYLDLLFSTSAIGKKGRKNQGRAAYSPVSAGKSLHLLCPGFFPLWDNKIAIAYGCKWKSARGSFDSYWNFMRKSAHQAMDLYKQGNAPSTLDKATILKLMDEYNYLRFTLKDKSFVNRLE